VTNTNEKHRSFTVTSYHSCFHRLSFNWLFFNGHLEIMQVPAGLLCAAFMD